MLVALPLLCKGCYRISIISAYLCERAQKIQIRYEWTRISDTSEQDLIAFNLKNKKISAGKCDGFRIDCKYIHRRKNSKVITSLGFSRRC